MRGQLLWDLAGGSTHIEFKFGVVLRGEFGVCHDIWKLVGCVVVAIPTELVDADIFGHARSAPC